MKKITVFASILLLLLVAVAIFAGAQSYGAFRDTGGGIYSNQPWCNEVTQMSGASGCAPDVLSTAYTVTAQAAANVNTAQNMVSVALPAGLMAKAGKTLIVKGSGTYSLGAASTVAIKVNVCTVSGCGSGTVVVPCTWTTASNTNTGVTSSFNYQCIIGTSTAGASGKLLGHGMLGIEVGAANTAALSMFGDISTDETAAIDLTKADYLQTSITFGTGNASNTATQQTSVVLVSN